MCGNRECCSEVCKVAREGESLFWGKGRARQGTRAGGIALCCRVRGAVCRGASVSMVVDV